MTVTIWSWCVVWYLRDSHASLREHMRSSRTWILFVFGLVTCVLLCRASVYCAKDIFVCLCYTSPKLILQAPLVMLNSVWLQQTHLFNPLEPRRAPFYVFFQKWKTRFVISQLLASRFSCFKAHTSCDWASLGVIPGHIIFNASHCDIRVLFTFVIQITCFYNFYNEICSRRLILTIPSTQHSTMCIYTLY